MVRFNINPETGNDNYAFQVITDLKLRARRQPSGATVLILASIDCDGVCGAVIFSSLLTREGIKFAVEPIGHIREAKTAISDVAKARMGQPDATRHRDVRSIVMIGCGCLEDLESILEDSGLVANSGNCDELIIYVFDSHRPIHLNNIYEKQNRVIIIDDDREGLGDSGIPPEPEDDEGSDSGSDSSGRRSPGRRDLLADESDDGDELSLDEDRRRKRPRVGGGSGNTPDPKQRRIEKREQREAMTEVYYDGHYRTTPASILLYRIAAEQQQGGQSSLWAACVALAGHLDAGLMSVPLYRDMSRQIYQQFAHEFDNTVEDLQPQRTENPNGDGEAQTSVHPLAKGGDGCISLEYREDLKLLLYRHCSLLEAFVHTPYTYAAAGLYHESGTRDVHQYFAECGLQPHSFNQVYISMPLHARLNLMEKLKKYGNRRGLFEMTHFDFLRRDNSAASQTGGPSAAGQVDHLNLTEMSASDMSVVVFAALEACGIPNDGSEDDDNSSTTPLQRKAFFDALDIIRGSNASGTRTALLRGLSVLRHVVSQAKAIRDRQMYKTVRRENDDTFRLTVLYRVVNPIICSPGVLRRLALFVLHIIYYKTSSRRADRGSLPYIVCCQMPNENFICLGVMPTSISAVGDKKSTFATRFLEASDESGASMDFKAFDASVVEVAGKDFQKWKEALQGQAGNRGDHGNGFDEDSSEESD